MNKVTPEQAVAAVKTLILMAAENESPLMEMKSTVCGERVGLVLTIGPKCCDMLEKAAKDIKQQAGLPIQTTPFRNNQNN